MSKISDKLIKSLNRSIIVTESKKNTRKLYFVKKALLPNLIWMKQVLGTRFLIPVT
jgi:hypothetical protein